MYANIPDFFLIYFPLQRAKYAVKSSRKNNVELSSVIFEGDGTSSWSKRTVNRNGTLPNANNQANIWQQTIPNDVINQANGTLLANTQKYYILDRDELNA